MRLSRRKSRQVATPRKPMARNSPAAPAPFPVPKRAAQRLSGPRACLLYTSQGLGIETFFDLELYPRKNEKNFRKGVDGTKKTGIIQYAVVVTVDSRECSRFPFQLWSSIEVVITSTTGNRVAANTARGFESLLLRQVKSYILVLRLRLKCSFFYCKTSVIYYWSVVSWRFCYVWICD